MNEADNAEREKRKPCFLVRTAVVSAERENSSVSSEPVFIKAVLALRAFPGNEKTDGSADPAGSVPAVSPGFARRDIVNNNVARAGNLGRNFLLDMTRDFNLLVSVFMVKPLAALPSEGWAA